MNKLFYYNNFSLVCYCNLLFLTSLTIILVSDCSKENKMTKISKNLTKCSILGLFCPNTIQSEIPAKIRPSFPGCKNNVTSLKKSEEN